MVKILDGILYSSGKNEYGQLGIGSFVDKKTPQRLNFFNQMKIKRIRCGSAHNFVLTDDDKLFGFGRNEDGQLGIFDVDQNYESPQLIEAFNDMKIQEIYCGSFHSLVLLDDGKLFVFGNNRLGQLGVDSCEFLSKPYHHSFFDDKGIISINCGAYFTFLSTKTKSVYCFGNNASGQLGIENLEDQYAPVLHPFFEGKKVLKLCCGGEHTFSLIEEKGKEVLYVFGYNGDGQLGIGNTEYQSVPEVLDIHNKSIKEIKLYYIHSLILTDDGVLYGCGNNDYGQIGLENQQNQYIPIEIDYFQGKKIQTIFESTIVKHPLGWTMFKKVRRSEKSIDTHFSYME